MAKEETKELLTFLQPFPESVKQTTLWSRDFIWDLYPESNELIYDNYNALAIGFSLTDKIGDAFCSIAVYSKHVNFGFNRGTEITDPKNMLKGEGSLYRYLTVTEKDFPITYVKKLLEDAWQNASAKIKSPGELKSKTITKSISAKKRRPQ